MQDPKQMAEQIKGYDLVDAQGKKLGTVESLWVDGATNKPEFLAVKPASGGETKILPFAGAQPDQAKRQIRVSYQEQQLASAPHFDETASLTEQDEEKIYKHYTVQRSQSASPTGLAGGAPPKEKPPEPPKAQQSGQSEITHKHDQDDPRATRGQTEHGGDEHTIKLEEERLKVSKQQEQVGEVHLGKKVTEQTEQVDVPLREEQVVIERRPASGQSRPGEITDSSGEINVPVSRERAVAEKETVVTEEVGIRKEATERTERVSDTVRKEELDVTEAGDLTESQLQNPNAPRTERYEQERSRRG